MGPYLQHAHTARVVFGMGVAAFAAGEFSQALRWRRGASHADLVGEIIFRLVFFAGIMMLPIGLELTPSAVIGGGAWVFLLGTVIGWLGLLLRWWSFVTLGRISPLWSGLPLTRRSSTGVPTVCCAIPATPDCS